MRLFFDLTVVLDVLARREPWYDHAAAALSLVEAGEAEGFMAAHTVTTLDYLLRKHTDRERASAALVDLLDLVTAVEVGHEALLKALSLGWADFEDAVQAVCAMDVDADFFLTRDPADFRALALPVVTPSEFLALLTDAQD